MNIATGEVMWPVMGAIKWNKTYLGMVATPLSVADMVAAHFAFVLFRVATTCGVFLVVLSLFGIFESVAGVLAAFLVQLLIGMAFATPLYGFSAGLENQGGFAIVYRVMLVPLFLFSGAFFPIEQPARRHAVARVWRPRSGTASTSPGCSRPARSTGRCSPCTSPTSPSCSCVGWWWSVRRLTRRLVH